MSKENNDNGMVIMTRPMRNRNTGATVMAAPVGTIRGETAYVATDSALNYYSIDSYSRGVGKGFGVGLLVGAMIMGFIGFIVSIVEEDKKEEKEGK